MRLHEIMGIEQNRRWGVCSLNDFRTFLGLKRESGLAFVHVATNLHKPNQHTRVSSSGTPTQRSLLPLRNSTVTSTSLNSMPVFKPRRQSQSLMALDCALVSIPHSLFAFGFDEDLQQRIPSESSLSVFRGIPT